MNLDTDYIFVPLGVATLGSWGPKAHKLFKEILTRLLDVTPDPKASWYLGQKIRLDVQRDNAASLLGTLLRGPDVNNVDEVLERHNDFLESCLGDCMLTSPQLLKAVTTLCSVCVQFCNFIQEMHKYFVDAELNSMLGPTYDNCDYSEEAGCGSTAASGPADSFSRSVSRYGLRFTAALLSVLAIIDQMARDNNTNKLLNISARLNFNTYYMKQLERFTEDKLLETNNKAS